MSQIYMWFVCKACAGCFLTVEDFLKHKKDQHFPEFQKTKCIVFAEQPQGQDHETDSDSNDVEVADSFSLACDLLTHHTNPTQKQAQTATSNSSSFVKLQDRVKLEVQAIDHRPQPQCEPYVLLKRLTEKQLDTAKTPQKLNQSISSKNFPEESGSGSSPSNEIAHRSVVKCEPVIFQVNAKSPFDANAVVNPQLKQEFTHNDEYFEEPENTESKLTYDIQEPHCSTQFSLASASALTNFETRTLEKNKANIGMTSLQNTILSKTSRVPQVEAEHTSDAKRHPQDAQQLNKIREAAYKFGYLLEPIKNIPKSISPSKSDLNFETKKINNKKVNADVVQVLSKSNSSSHQNQVKSKRCVKPAVRPVCHTCSKSFKDKYVLNIHLDIAHSTARRFGCRCGKAYKYFHDLTSHKRKQNLKKENGKSYNMICLEDYVKSCRKKKSRKSCNSKSLERPAETFDSSGIHHSSIDSLNLTEAPVPVASKSADLQDVIKLEMDIESPKTQSCSRSHNTILVPQTMAKEHQTPKPTKVIGIDFRPEPSLNEFITCNSNSAENSRIVALFQFKRNNDNNEGLSRSTEPKLAHDLQVSHCSSPFNSNASTFYNPESQNIPQQKSALNLETETNLIRMERQVKISAGVDKSNFPKKQYNILKPDKRPVCHICAKSLGNKYSLKRHLERHHSTIRRFRCRCGRAYKYEGDFKRHEQAHQCKLISSVG